jgi:hypothetical protein
MKIGIVYGSCSHSPPRSGFVPLSVRLRFVVDDVALEQVFVLLLVTIIPPMPHTTLYLYFTVTRLAKPGNFPKTMLFLKCGAIR